MNAAGRADKELAESEVAKGDWGGEGGALPSYFFPLSVRPILDYRACSQTSVRQV